MATSRKLVSRDRRRARVRRRVRGTEERPRLSVFRSDKHMYAQVVVDTSGQTLLTVSTRSPELRGELTKTRDVAAAKQVGLLTAPRCPGKGIQRVIFHPNG